MATSSRAVELPASVRHDLTRMLAMARDGTKPVSVTFATDNYATLLRNWLRHAWTAGAARHLVVAMDAALADRLERDGIAAVRHGFDGTIGDLWYQRTLIFEWLARQGVDFIHSDVDAVWLRDPRPFCFADNGLDLVFSQGINYPAEAWRQWGFVLCCGLFAARATAATVEFLTTVRALTAEVGDDQVCVNALLWQGGMSWRHHGIDSYQLVNRYGQAFTCYRQMIEGVTEQGSLRVGLLPHDRVPRLPIAGNDALARHPVGTGDSIVKLRAAGCWMDG